MLQQFKAKEQLKKEKIYKAAEDLNGVMKERFIRLATGEEKADDRLFYSNLFIKAKFGLRNTFKNLDEYSDELKETRKLIKLGRSKEQLEKLKKYENVLVGAIASFNEHKLNYGRLLVDSLIPMINKYFTEHEIIQLVGGSEVTAREHKETMERLELGGCKDEDGGFAFDFIFHHGEYRWRRGRAKDFIDCPEWEMPLFNAISDYIIHQVRSTPKLKYEMDKKCEEMFEDAMVYATFDNNGNIRSTERINQEVKIISLLLNYKDLEQNGVIARIKKEPIIDTDKKIRLHKNQGNNYTVLDTQGKKLGYVFKIN